MFSTEARRVQKHPEDKAVPPADRTTRPTMEEHRLKKVFICSPFRPLGNTREERAKELDRNTELALDACTYAVEKGCMPYAPHMYFPRFLTDEDPEERKAGIELGLRWLKECDEVWVIGNRITEGMKAEIGKAHELHMPIRHIVKRLSPEARILMSILCSDTVFEEI